MQTPVWQQAAAFAARAHEHQKRQDGRTPYIAHPVRVALTVRDLFGCADQTALCAALLHDTIEDTTADFDEIEEAFGRPIAACVAALTKNMALPEKQREPEYDARLSAADWRARLVKLADVYDNLSDLRSARKRDRNKIRRAIRKCERAIKLAAPDIRAHQESRRAIAAVRALVRATR